MGSKESTLKNVAIRESGLDRETLHLLIEMSADWEAEDSCRGYRKNTREDIEGNRIFLADAGGETAGYLFGKIESSKNSSSIMPEGTPCFEVEEIYVRPSYRNRGIGSMLFRAAEQAVSGEAEYILLSTATKNWRAILHFYIEELDMDFWSARLFKKLDF